MKIDFEQSPFASLEIHLRAWFEAIVKDPDLSPTSKFWRMPLPAGSTMSDAIVVSECMWALFPEAAETANALCTPVGAEFVL